MRNSPLRTMARSIERGIFLERFVSQAPLRRIAKGRGIHLADRTAGENDWGSIWRARLSRIQTAEISCSSPQPRSARSGSAPSPGRSIDQMNPDASTLALSSIEVDIGAIAEGQIVTVKWRGGPVFIRHRTQKEIDEAVNTPLSELKDPQTDQQRVKRPEWLIVVGDLHAFGMRAAGPRRPVRRLEVPVPWLGLRHLRAHSPGARAAQSRRARIRLPERHEGEDRLSPQPFALHSTAAPEAHPRELKP